MKQSMSHLTDLPDEILVEILSRLRVGTLWKFKSVCKHWLQLLSDPYFHSLHQKKSQQKPMLLYFQGRFHPPDGEKFGDSLVCVDLDGDIKYRKSLPGPENAKASLDHIYSSCRNLVCLVTRKSFYLCNPSIQELVRTPEPTCNPFELNNSGHLVLPRMTGGFGFLASRNEFVIIHFITDIRRSYMGCEILNFSSANLSSCSWRQIDEKCPYEPDQVDNWGTLVNKVFYWKIYDDMHNSILSFDLEEEKFETVPPPPARHGTIRPGDHIFLLEHNGHLAYIDKKSSPFVVEIWSLRDSRNKTWMKYFSIRLPHDSYSMDLLNSVEEVGGELMIVDYYSEDNSGHKKRSVGYYNKQNNRYRRKFETTHVMFPFDLHLYTDNFFSFGSR